MARTLLPLLLILTAACQKQTDGFTIHGLTDDMADSTMIYLFMDNADADSTMIMNNEFTFQGKIGGDFSYVWIHTKNYTSHKALWLANSDITFDASNSSFQEAPISGSRMQDQNDELDSLTASMDMQMDSIRHLIPTVADSAKEPLRSAYLQFFNQKNDLALSFIQGHTDYEFSAYLLNFLKNDTDKKITQELYDGLDSRIKQTPWGQTIALHLAKSVKLNIGDQAVDFQLPALDSSLVALSDFRGKYTLLEFWSTACAPCRLENPNLLHAYKSYRDQGFEILGVTLDMNRSQWQATVEHDSMIWTTVGDLKGISGEVPITYSVNFIPKNYLLDPNGIVIAEDLSDTLLLNRLREIFEANISPVAELPE